MQTFFTQMNEEYINKHYPKRSVFAAVNKSNKKNGVGVNILCGIFVLMFGAGIVWSIGRLLEYKEAGESDMMSTGFVILGFFIVMLVLSLVPIIITIKRNSLGAEGLIKKSAKISEYSESIIREFDRQALESDSYILALTSKIKAVLIGQRNGVLTRDFIFLADAKNIVMKRSDLVGAYLVARTVYTNGNSNIRTPLEYLTVSIISNKGIQTLAETSLEAGKALIAMLKEQNPELDTNDSEVMKETDYNKYWKKRFASLI